MIEDYIKDSKCPYCNHTLNHGSNVSGDNEKLSNRKANSLTLGLCYYCAHIIGYVNKTIIPIDEDLENHIKRTKPELYSQLLEAQKTLLEVKDGE